jgi:membrane-anchored protein YejM (alkaline phosphatase superfamily)
VGTDGAPARPPTVSGVGGAFGRFWLANAGGFALLGLYAAHATQELSPGAAAVTVAYGLGCALPVCGACWVGAWALTRLASPWMARAAAVLGAGLTGGLLVVDARFFVATGVHLYSPFVEAALRNVDVMHTVHVGPAAVLSAAVTVATALLGEAVLLRAAEWAAARASSTAPMRLAVGALALLLASALGVLSSRKRVLGPGGLGSAVLPLDELLEAHTRRPPKLVVDYAPGLPPAGALSKTPNIIFLVVESLRADALTPDRMPRLDRYAAEHRCLRSERHFSSSHLTQLGVFSLLYGLDALHYDAFSTGDVASYPLSVLRSAGYWVGGASASALKSWSGAGFITRQLDPYFEPADEESYVRDRHLVEWIARTQATGALREPFFLFAFFDSTHFDYSYPPEFERERPSLPAHWAAQLGDGTNPDVRASAIHRYDNAVFYVDSLIGEVLDGLRGPIDRGDLVVVVTGDHGEEMWDEGMFGHAAPRFVDARVHVPLVVCLPGVDAPPVALSSHVDVLPTVLDYAGLPPRDAARWLNGVSLLRDDASRPDRWVAITAAGFPQISGRLALATRARKYWLVEDAEWLDRFAVLRTTDHADRDVDELVPREMLSAFALRVTRFSAARNY